VPRGVQGKSHRPLLDDPEAEWDRPAFSVFGRKDRVIGLAARTERYRYAEYLDGTAMLFDHESDPHERKNLADSPEHRAVRKELHKVLAAWRKREGVPEPKR
jgi:iduronate 2-sulfatase